MTSVEKYTPEFLAQRMANFRRDIEETFEEMQMLAKDCASFPEVLEQAFVTTPLGTLDILCDERSIRYLNEKSGGRNYAKFDWVSSDDFCSV